MTSFCPLPGHRDLPICEVTLLRLWQTPPFLVASLYPRHLTLGQPGYKHRPPLTLQSFFYLSLLSVEMTLVRHPPLSYFFKGTTGKDS